MRAKCGTGAPVLIEVSARAAGHTGVGRWIHGFCDYLASKGIAYREISASSWAASARGWLGVAARVRIVRNLLYYTFGLRKVSACHERVVVLDNIGRLTLPLPASARPFYLIHDLIPLEMSGRLVRETLGVRAAAVWAITRRLYRARLKRILFAPGARFGYISRATEAAAHATFGPPAVRGKWIGPMMLAVAANNGSDLVDARIANLVREQPYVLALGTGDPKKGLRSLLSAWRAARVGNRLRLVLFGAGWKGKGHRWIEATLREMGEANVIHVGPVSDATLRCLYRNAAAFVFPSYFEGLGLPPAEYCLEGSGDLILRDIPALREIYGDVACFFASETELVSLLRGVAERRIEPPVTAEVRRQRLQARLDPSAAFERLLAAVLSECA